MKPAIIFDLDGTLWDPIECTSNIWNIAFAKHDEVSLHMTGALVHDLLGKTLPEIGRILFPELSEAKQSAIIADFSDELVRYVRAHGAILFDGVRETIEELSKSYALCIVSNCCDGYIEGFMHAHKLEPYFTDFESQGRTGLEKAENIRLVLDRNAFCTAFYVGDTDGDERAAHAAGIPFIHAAYGFGKAIAPEARISDIRMLPACLKTLI